MGSSCCPTCVHIEYRKNIPLDFVAVHCGTVFQTLSGKKMGTKLRLVFFLRPSPERHFTVFVDRFGSVLFLFVAVVGKPRKQLLS